MASFDAPRSSGASGTLPKHEAPLRQGYAGPSIRIHPRAYARGFLRRRVKIAGKKFFCPVVFSHEYMVSFNFLGREAFFGQFKIIFEEKKNLLKLE